jgi:hypothetical protein
MNDTINELIDKLAFTLFGGSREIWDRKSPENEHYIQSASSLIPIVADIWQEANDIGFSEGYSDVEPREQTQNPYRTV